MGTPGSFDPATAREYIGDEQARVIEAKARADADAGRYLPPPPPAESATYASAVYAEMEGAVYFDQFQKRRWRNERKGGAT